MSLRALLLLSVVALVAARRLDERLGLNRLYARELTEDEMYKPAVLDADFDFSETYGGPTPALLSESKCKQMWGWEIEFRTKFPSCSWDYQEKILSVSYKGKKILSVEGETSCKLELVGEPTSDPQVAKLVLMIADNFDRHMNIIAEAKSKGHKPNVGGTHLVNKTSHEVCEMLKLKDIVEASLKGNTDLTFALDKSTHNIRYCGDTKSKYDDLHSLKFLQINFGVNADMFYSQKFKDHLPTNCTSYAMGLTDTDAKRDAAFSGISNRMEDKAASRVYMGDTINGIADGSGSCPWQPRVTAWGNEADLCWDKRINKTEGFVYKGTKKKIISSVGKNCYNYLFKNYVDRGSPDSAYNYGCDYSKMDARPNIPKKGSEHCHKKGMIVMETRYKEMRLASPFKVAQGQVSKATRSKLYDEMIRSVMCIMSASRPQAK